MPNLPNADEPHRVPSGFYKIITYGNQTEAYLFDQDTPEGADYRSGLTTVEEIERLTGLGFR